MNTILFWTLVIVGTGLFVYFLPYRNIKNVQKLQREGLEKLDTVIELLRKKDK
jgi:predicted helicase